MLVSRICKIIYALDATTYVIAIACFIVVNFFKEIMDLTKVLNK